MDVFLAIVVFIVFCILFSVCGWCCKKQREGTVYGYAGQPTVTITPHPNNTVITPYPTNTLSVGAPAPGFVHGQVHTNPYAPAQFQAAPHLGAPYPPAAPYPVHPMPPSYSEAVGRPSQPQPPIMSEGYSKQAPYNPNF